jgi:3-oxoacyl-[acyl-carrier protein] reductase
MARLSTLSRSIAGQVAVVTGAASGMGRATAQLFADEGALVAVLDQDGDGATAVAAEITDAGGRAAGWTADVTDAAMVAGVIGAVRDDLGPVDILVNNAGVNVPVGIEDDGYDRAWDTVLAVNLTGYTTMVRACFADLARNQAGRIVNVASTEGLGASPRTSPYTSSKHGVIGLTRALAVELGRRGITVNCVCPGPIHTGMTAVIPDEHKDRFARRRVPIGRYGAPEEVAHATLSLVLPAASFINAAVLVVDGGLTAQNT